jgi:hypothetical protein
LAQQFPGEARTKARRHREGQPIEGSIQFHGSRDAILLSPFMSRCSSGRAGFQSPCGQSIPSWPAAKQTAEKVGFFVIPSAVRDLLFLKCQEKSGFLGQLQPSE